MYGRRPKASHRQQETSRRPYVDGSGGVYQQGPLVDVTSAVIRKDALVRYRDDAAISDEQLAVRLMLPVERLRGLLSGKAPITNELATHIEEMLALPSSWLDIEQPDRPEPSSTEQTASTDFAAAPLESAAASSGANDMNEDAQYHSSLDSGREDRSIRKRQIADHRRQNLVMLTSQRGSKLRLAELAGTSGSRISLMTSGRKPVSETFALGIEDGLELPRRWLDVPHNESEVPAAVWQRLKVDAPAGQPQVAHTAHKPTPRASGKSTQVGAMRGSVSPVSARPLDDSGEVALLEEAEEASSAPIARELRARATIASFASGGSALFEKEAGKVGAIAEALAKTILRLSETDRLSELRAFQMLGMLVDESANR